MLAHVHVCVCRFGFNAHATYLHGLWAGQASANSDFAAIAWQFKLLGFNTIRLPFLFGDLWTPAENIGGTLAQQPALKAQHAHRQQVTYGMRSHHDVGCCTACMPCVFCLHDT